MIKPKFRMMIISVEGSGERVHRGSIQQSLPGLSLKKNNMEKKRSHNVNIRKNWMARA